MKGSYNIGAIIVSKVTNFARHHGLSLGLLILTAIYAFGIPQIRSLFDEGLVGTRFLPQLLVIITISCLVLIMLRDMKKASISNEQISESARGNAKPIILFIATLVYIALFKSAGFLIATFLFSFSVLWLFSHASEKLLARALIAASISGLAYLLFAVAFGTHLNIFPAGF